MRVTVRAIQPDTLIEGLREFSVDLAEQCLKTVQIEKSPPFEHGGAQPFSVDVDFDFSELFRYASDCDQKIDNLFKKRFKNKNTWNEIKTHRILKWAMEQIARSLEIGRDVGDIEYIKEKLSSRVAGNRLNVYYDEEDGETIEIKFNEHLSVKLCFDGFIYALYIVSKVEEAYTHWHPYIYSEAIQEMTDIIEGRIVFVAKRHRRKKEHNKIETLSLQKYESKKEKLFRKDNIAIFSSLGVLKESNHQREKSVQK